MKGLVLPVTALCVLAIAVPAAQAAPTSDTGCAIEHVTGAECQGPDADPAADVCQINTWVDNATCTLTVQDGVAELATGFADAYAEIQGTNWHAEFHFVIRDASTGAVLYSEDNSLTVPIAEQPLLPAASNSFSTIMSPAGGSEVVCEVTGTHNPAGAATSAIAASSVGFGQWNNIFRCSVD